MMYLPVSSLGSMLGLRISTAVMSGRSGRRSLISAQVGPEHQVLIDELGREAIVGLDAADLGGGDDDLVDLVPAEGGVDGLLIE